MRTCTLSGSKGGTIFARERDQFGHRLMFDIRLERLGDGIGLGRD